MRPLALFAALVACGCNDGNGGGSSVTPAGTPGSENFTPSTGVRVPNGRSPFVRVPQGRVGPPADLGVAPTVDMADPAPDLASDPVDLGVTALPDLGRAIVPDLAPPPPSDGSPYTPPSGSDDPVTHAAPASLAGVTTLLGGQNVLDVSTDQGGGVWAVTSSTVYYFPAGRASPFTYNQASGLARGWWTWNDDYYGYGNGAPVTFASVAGAMSGEAVIGNVGAIADRMIVSPSSGAVQRIDNMQVTIANIPADKQWEYPEHIKRVVAGRRAIADLNGTYEGTAYIGGFHGYYAYHGLGDDCGCLAFEEHQHGFINVTTGGGDVRGLALSPDGDVWQGDRDMVTLLPQRSRGPRTGFFDFDFTATLDVFPDVRDEVWGLAVDGTGGVYVASYGNGLAYLAPATYAASYWSSATTLPQNHLTSVAVDAHGDVWVATADAGLARLHPSTGTWTYYTRASGLPSNDANVIYADRLTGSNRLYVATTNGIAIFTP
jgi:ligand-binding sensor domain-containing protein